jgi:molybdopterin molybdotransferase
MRVVATVSFDEGRQMVVATVQAACKLPETETVSLLAADGRVLAEDVRADRDYPAADRSIRDGFAVRSVDLDGRALRVIGEAKAGGKFPGTVATGEAVEIMTGAPVPSGADQIVMVEHVTREDGSIRTPQGASPGQFINPKGVEARVGETVIHRGKRLGFADIALLATVGRASMTVYRQPRVAILATGDEVVPVEAIPTDEQVRNSNSMALAAQVVRAGGLPVVLPVAKDDLPETRRLIAEGLQCDLLLMSGGVSAGKYDLVEQVLGEFGAEFVFDRVLIQPGQPLVFGKAQGRFFFGLPGNPASTMVTFELFASLALRLLGGEAEPRLRIATAALTEPFRHKTGLTRFLPATLCDGRLTPIAWQGSSDVPSLSRANSFLIARPDRTEWPAGEAIEVLLP